MLFINRSIWALVVGMGLLPVFSLADEAETLSLESGNHRVVVNTQPVKRVAVGNPDVAGITVMTTHNLMVTGKQVGATEISIWESEHAAQPDRVIRVVVSAATSLEHEAVEAIGSVPLTVAAAGKSPALTGRAASLEKHALARQVIDDESKGPLDASVTDFENQVQIDIKVVEVSRQSMKRAGLFFGRNQGNRTFAVSPPGTLSGIESGGSGFTLNSASGFLSSLDTFNFVLGNAGSGLLATLSVLEANGFAYTLAEPSLTAISGQSATFLAGGEFPVPIRSGGGSDSTVTIKYKEYGVRLMLTPTVLAAERIFLKVSPEVSELDFNNAVQTGGVAVPGLTVRRTDTSVALGNGESFVISGLVSRNTLSNVDKFPWLGNIPILGAFFRSTRYDREDKELLMVVTPHLVRPLAKHAATPPLPGSDVHDYDPSFSELFFQTGGAKLPAMGLSR